MKIIYTTGIFDLFHIGHLNLLREAKKLGDYLIVGVSTDEFAESYKGEKPVIPFGERLRIVGMNQYVDIAIAQRSVDKIDNMNIVGADTLAVGDDWKEKGVMGGEAILEAGKEIIYIPYTEGISTTILKERILNHGK